MDEDEVLARFGISSRLAYGLLAQSILVFCVAILSLWEILDFSQGFTLSYITNIFLFLVCIALLVYSFFGYKANRSREAIFMAAIILYIIVILFRLFTSAISFKNPVSILTVVTLISMIYFLHEYRLNYKVANFAMLISLASGLIVLIFNVMGGMHWLVAIKYIVVPITIALTYFERVQRGKYDFAI